MKFFINNVIIFTFWYKQLSYTIVFDYFCLHETKTLLFYNYYSVIYSL